MTFIKYREAIIIQGVGSKTCILFSSINHISIRQTQVSCGNTEGGAVYYHSVNQVYNEKQLWAIETSS